MLSSKWFHPSLVKDENAHKSSINRKHISRLTANILFFLPRRGILGEIVQHTSRSGSFEAVPSVYAGPDDGNLDQNVVEPLEKRFSIQIRPSCTSSPARSVGTATIPTRLFLSQDWIPGPKLFACALQWLFELRKQPHSALWSPPTHNVIISWIEKCAGAVLTSIEAPRLKELRNVLYFGVKCKYQLGIKGDKLSEQSRADGLVVIILFCYWLNGACRDGKNSFLHSCFRFFVIIWYMLMRPGNKLAAAMGKEEGSTRWILISTLKGSCGRQL